MEPFHSFSIFPIESWLPCETGSELLRWNLSFLAKIETLIVWALFPKKKKTTIFFDSWNRDTGFAIKVAFVLSFWKRESLFFNALTVLLFRNLVVLLPADLGALYKRCTKIQPFFKQNCWSVDSYFMTDSISLSWNVSALRPLFWVRTLFPFV